MAQDKRSPVFRPYWYQRPLTAVEGKLAGSADAPDVVRKSIRSATHREVGVAEAWVEQPMGDWIVAYRILPQGGVPVIGEVRVFPRKPRTTDTPGRWDGEVLGLSVEVPEGGLATRHLRRVTVGEH